MANTTVESYRRYTCDSDNSQPIFVLGSSGNIGKLFSKALASKPQPPPITLLLHRSNLLEAWKEAGNTIELITDGIKDRSGKYNVEDISASSSEADLPGSVIKNLIVATKTIHTVAALLSIRNRLDASSTILFAQNGMGTVEEVNQEVFAEDSSRPRYLACVVSHGLYTQGPFSAVHAGRGTVVIGDVQAGQQNEAFITRQVMQTPLLGPKQVCSSDLKLLQLEKLVMNAIINPLTVIFNCRNGELFSRPLIAQLMDGLLSEISQVIRALPELHGDPGIQDWFSVERLRSLVLNIADVTAQNMSSMLQDVRAGRPTEIDYINGYVVRRGEELKIACSQHEKLVAMVKDVQVIKEAEIGQHFPGFWLRQM